MRLSIIIPVYNIDKYVSSCIKSVLNEKMDDFELLLINDGSTDNSGEICNQFALEDDRVKVFHQKNAGVSNARNRGLDECIGDWILFIDGDDSIVCGALTTIMSNPILDGCPDVVTLRSFVVDKDGVKKEERYPFKNEFVQKVYSGRQLIYSEYFRRGSICGCLFNKEFLNANGLRFPEGLWNGEDSIFSSLYYIYADRIAFINLHLYNVNQREGSASRSWTRTRVFRLFDNIDFIYHYIETNPLQEWQRNILYQNIFGTISVIYNGIFHCFSIKDFLFVSKRLDQIKLDVGKITKHKKKIALFNLSPYLFGATVLGKRLLKL